MFLVCTGCHKVVGEVEPLHITEIKQTVCNECQCEAKLRYFNMLNELYFKGQQVLKTGIDTK